MAQKPLLKSKIVANRLGLPESTPAKHLLTRDEIAAEYGISRRWLELAALSGNGPPTLHISPVSALRIRRLAGCPEVNSTSAEVDSTR